MNVDDMILVSVDDHVIEPAHMFEGRVPTKYADNAPRFVRRDDGTMAWRYDGQEILNTALNAVAGRPPRSSARTHLHRGDPHRLLRHRGPSQGHERQRRAGIAVLSRRSRGSAASCSWRPPTANRPRRWSAPTTTGTSRSGRELSRPHHSPCAADDVGPRGHRRRGASGRGQGLSRRLVLLQPLRSGLAQPLLGPLGPVLAGMRRRGHRRVHAPGSNSRPPMTSPDAPIELVYTLSPVSLFSAAADLLWSPVF